MNKKPPVSRFSKPKAKVGSDDQTWHNGAAVEIHLYARSLQNAARTLVGKLELGQAARTDWDTCPIVLLYRNALELHLKALVREGSNFLKSKTDSTRLRRESTDPLNPSSSMSVSDPGTELGQLQPWHDPIALAR